MDVIDLSRTVKKIDRPVRVSQKISDLLRSVKKIDRSFGDGEKIDRPRGVGQKVAPTLCGRSK